jgi:small subunit ribosomal protein S21
LKYLFSSGIMFGVKEGGVVLMTKVVVKNGNVEGALRMFKQKNIKNGLLKEVREREHYSKPGVKKRLAKMEAIKNSKKNSKKDRRD